MPATNPLTPAQDGALIANMKSIILEYSARILATETPFQNAGNTNYIAYNKRMALASEIISTKGELHAKQAAFLIADAKPDIVVNYENDFSTLYSNNAAETKVVYGNGFGTASNNDPLQLFNILAGVNQLDMI